MKPFDPALRLKVEKQNRLHGEWELKMKQGVASARPWAKNGYVALGIIVIALVFLQVYFAGHAILIKFGDWGPHTMVGHWFTPLILAMLVVALVGRMPARFSLYALGVFGLYSMQFVFLYWLPFARALHPVNALFIFSLAFYTVKSAWRLPGLERVTQ